MKDALSLSSFPWLSLAITLFSLMRMKEKSQSGKDDGAEKERMGETVLVIEESASCRRQAFARRINQGIDVAALVFSQAVFCSPAHIRTVPRQYSYSQNTR